MLSAIEDVLSLESVACKDWLTNKVDRCVTGRVAIAAMRGTLQLPLNNVGVTAVDQRGAPASPLQSGTLRFPASSMNAPDLF